MPKNIIQKIWDAHVVSQDSGHPAVFAIDLMLIHEVTSAQAFSELRSRGLKPYDVSRLVATLDHSIPTRKNRLEIYDEQARNQVETLRNNAKEFGVPIYDFGSGHQGVVHVIGPELGLTQPGMTIVCGDSHTSTHGAFGAMAFGVGTSEVGHVMATSCLLQQMPKTMRVNFVGKRKPWVFSKDAILKLISQIGIAGGNGHIIEYTGEGIRDMSMEERMTVCNMSIECGARAGIISPDETTLGYIKGKAFAPKDEDWEEAKEYWLSFASDSDASFDLEVTVDLNELEPMVTWGTNPEQGVDIGKNVPVISDLPSRLVSAATGALKYTGVEEGKPVEGLKVDWAFIGSCTNGRIEDLRVAAEVLKGKKVNSSVTMYIIPGSESVRDQAISEGLDQIFDSAGADFRMPGCSMCLGMNDDKVPAGKRCISSSNRNFVGRQGEGSITHLASPATVAASAVAGVISNPKDYFKS